MVPRGEVGLIVAGIGRAQGILTDTIFSAVVVMTIVTTLVAPPVLKLLLRGDPRSLPTRAPASAVAPPHS
jgi:Kef-type K+ transport system membrane component KefB